MISYAALIKGIQERYRQKEPLNITTIKREAPNLMEKAFDPKNREFLGWRGALEAAGVDYAKIKIHLAAEVDCPICEKPLGSLMSHLSRVHQVTGAELREEHPDLQLLCDQELAARAALLPDFTPKNRKLVVNDIPHWEPLWTIEYAIDRIRYIHDLGYQVHNRSIDRIDSSLKFFVFHNLPSWDDFLQRAHLDHTSIRKLQHQFEYTREFMLEKIQEHHAAGDSLAVTALTKRYPGYRWACQRFFGTHQDALKAAGIVPEDCIRINGIKTKKNLRAEARELLKQFPEQIPEAELKAFRKRWQATMAQHYGGWAQFAKSMKVAKDRFFQYSPIYTKGELLSALANIKRRKYWDTEDMKAFREKWGVTMSRYFTGWNQVAEKTNTPKELLGIETKNYNTKRKTIAAICRYDRENFPMFIGRLKQHDPALAVAVRQFFDDDWYAAFEVAGVAPARRKKQEFNKEDVLDALRTRYEAGAGILNKDLTSGSKNGGDQRLHQVILEYFGTVDEAIEAAGLPSAVEQRAESQGPSMQKK